MQDNVAALLTRPEIDGVLVGGASLQAEGWAELVEEGLASTALRLDARCEVTRAFRPELHRTRAFQPSSAWLESPRANNSRLSCLRRPGTALRRTPCSRL